MEMMSISTRSLIQQKNETMENKLADWPSLQDDFNHCFPIKISKALSKQATVLHRVPFRLVAAFWFR
jgi:hypothetical protein